MKYTTEEALKEINRRGNILKEEHERKVTKVMSICTAATAFVLVALLSIFSGSGMAETRTQYGSFLLPTEAGGYVLTAVVAFALGVMLTIVIKRIKARNHNG